MKKLVALVLALVMGLSLVSTAFAAETYDNDNTAVQVTTTENGRTYEKVRMAITRDGHIAAVKTLQSAYSTLKPFDKEEIEKISHLKNGGIIRGKGLIKGSLDESNMLAEGSTIATLALEVINLEELSKAVGEGVVLNAVTVMDAASIHHDGHIGHRAIDRPTNLVARFHQQNGTFINVFYDVFDGSRKLVFDAEAVSAPAPAPEQPAPEKPLVTPAPEQPQQPAPEKPVVTPVPEQPQQPNPENDDVILPWDNAPNTSNNNAGGSTQPPSQEPEPAPENDDVTLPW